MQQQANGADAWVTAFNCVAYCLRQMDQSFYISCLCEEFFKGGADFNTTRVRGCGARPMQSLRASAAQLLEMLVTKIHGRHMQQLLHLQFAKDDICWLLDSQVFQLLTDRIWSGEEGYALDAVPAWRLLWHLLLRAVEFSPALSPPHQRQVQELLVFFLHKFSKQWIWRGTLAQVCGILGQQQHAEAMTLRVAMQMGVPSSPTTTTSPISADASTRGFGSTSAAATTTGGGGFNFTPTSAAASTSAIAASSPFSWLPTPTTSTTGGGWL